MTDRPGGKPKPGDKVLLMALPPGLLDGLPPEDQRAISRVVRKAILLNEYDEHGRAELQFTAADGRIHFIWVSPEFIKAAK
jgi:hypothetical protein